MKAESRWSRLSRLMRRQCVCVHNSSSRASRAKKNRKFHKGGNKDHSATKDTPVAYSASNSLAAPCRLFGNPTKFTQYGCTSSRRPFLVPDTPHASHFSNSHSNGYRSNKRRRDGSDISVLFTPGSKAQLVHSYGYAALLISISCKASAVHQSFIT